MIVKQLYSLILLLLLVSCVGTIEEADETIGSVDKTPVADFTFNGADKGLWVSDTKVSVRFSPAFGASGKFRYQLLDEGGNVLTAEDGDNLLKDSNGQYHLTHSGFIGGTVNRLLVRAIELETNAPDKNTKYVTVNLPSDLYPDFNGITRCEAFPGAGGQSKLNVFWEKGRIYPSGLPGLNLQHSVGSYRIYYCKKQDGTDCLETDSAQRISQSVTDPLIENMTVSGVEPNTSYYFRVTAVSQGSDGDPATQREERNIEFFECKTQNASGPIIFSGIEEVNIDNNEDGINQAQTVWSQASGGFSAYKVYYHPVIDQTSVFNYSHPNIQVLDIIDTNATFKDLIGLDSFTYHAFLVRACESLISDPTCANGNDGNGKFIVKQTKPGVASFAGISGTTNDVSNPSNIYLDFTPADLSSGGIFDEYRVFVGDGTNIYDISTTHAGSKLGDIYPAAPTNYRDLYLDGFIRTNIAATQVKLNGLKPSVVYEADVKACVSRTSPLPISGGNIVADYCSIGTVPTAVTNNDVTPPQIISMSVSPLSGTVKINEKVTFVVGYNEILSISGNPRISIDVGGVVKYANYVSNTPTSITFEYTALSGDNDLDGITFNSTSIALNGGIISDLSENNASLNFVAVVPDMSAINVDTLPPLAPVNVVFTRPWLSSVTKIQQASWVNPVNDFHHAEVGVGSSGSGAANTVAFVTSSGSNNHTFPDITGGLVECSQEYEVVVRALDGANLASPVAVSLNKFRLDKTPPTTPIISLDGTSSDVFIAPEISWAIANDSCSLHHYEISIGKDDDSDGFDAGDVDNVMPWTEVPGGIGVNTYIAASGTDDMVFALNATDNFRISVRAVDSAGNVSVESTTADFVVDIAGPSTPTSLTIGSNWITGADPVSSPLFSWVNPTDPDFQHVKVALGSTIGAEDVRVPLHVGTFTSYTWTNLTGLSECSKTYPKVVAFDDIGNPSAPGTHPNVWFALDNTNPIVTGDIDISAGGQELATHTAPFANFGPAFRSDNCGALDFIEIAIGWDNESDGFDAGDLDNTLAFTQVPGGAGINSYQAVNGVDGMFFNLVAGRDYFVSIRVTDRAGNISSAITSTDFFGFVLDNTAPTVAITTSALNPTSTAPFPITITFDEDVTGFTVGDIAVTNGTAGGFSGGPRIYTANITPTDFGRVRVNIGAGVAQDGASNPNDAATELSLIYASTDTFRSLWAVNAGETITLPLRSGFSYDFYVDWGDGSPAQLVSSWNDANSAHTYASGGSYTITCTGLMQSFILANGSMKTKITSVTSLGNMGWRNLNQAFFGATNLLSFSGGVVDNVTDMQQMFRDTPALTTMNISAWNTGKVTNMYLMFYNTPFANPDVSNWDVSKVTQFQQMFDNADGATPNTTNWNTSSATNMAYMFRNAALANPDTTNWDVSNVTTMRAMFENADSANPNTANWNTGNVRDMAYMFYNNAIANPDTSNWDTSEVIDMGVMFLNADSANPNTATWNTSKVTTMNQMFYSANVANPDVSNWDVSKVTDMYRMFRDAPLASPVTTNWDTGRVTNMQEMFYNADLANPDTTNWDTSRVTTMAHMFALTAIANPNTANWDTSRVTSMYRMFYLALQANPNTTNWNTALVNDMSGMFRDAPVANPDTTNWNTALVTNMAEMFYNADSATPNTASWNTGNVTNMGAMFFNTDLANPDTTNWNTGLVTNMRSMFYLSQSANPNTTNWNTSNVTNMGYMFCQAQEANPNMINWDTSKVTAMDLMFYYAPEAQAIGTDNWDTGNVTNMYQMFRRASVAEPVTTNWDVGKVTNMAYMFDQAVSANPDTSNWVTSSLVSAYAMFNGAPSANPDTSSWTVATTTDMRYMFWANVSSFSNLNYSNYLVMVNATTNHLGQKYIHANTSLVKYQPFAAAARANLIANGWIITDGGPE